MIYLKSIEIPDDDKEFVCLLDEKRTIFNTCYPFKVFPQKRFEKAVFSEITVFYGGNGSGKTTLLNIICEKINAIRHSEFSSSGYFERYLDLCSLDYRQAPQPSHFLSSDDVFDYVMNMRYLNKDIDNHREKLISGYATMKERAVPKYEEDFEAAQEYRTLHGLEDYDRWKEVTESFSRNSSQSQFVKSRLSKNIDMFSNGETALKYFVDHIESDAIYLLDEPENSLSVEYQLKLKSFIEDSARFYNCQFIISTHSPILLSISRAKIYDLDECPVKTKRWTELNNVRKYFDFFMENKDEFENR